MSDHFPNRQRDHKPPRRGLPAPAIIVLILLCGAVGLYALIQAFPSALAHRDEQISLVYLGALGVAILVSSLSVRRLGKSDLGRYLRYGLLWAAVFIVLAGGYSYRFELQSFGQRLAGGLLPGYGSATGPNEVAYTRSGDGHFYIDAEAGRVPIRFLVDTGASTVVLSPADAQRLGFNLAEVHFDQIFQTANGTVRGASAVLNELWLGERRVTNLRVSINEAPMSHSLLGMTFLRQLESYEVRGDRLYLRWRPGAG